MLAPKTAPDPSVVPDLPPGGLETSFLTNRDFDRLIGRVGYRSRRCRVLLQPVGRKRMEIQASSEQPPMRQTMDVTGKLVPSRTTAAGMTQAKASIQLWLCSTSPSGRCRGCRERNDDAESSSTKGSAWTGRHSRHIMPLGTQ